MGRNDNKEANSRVVTEKQWKGVKRGVSETRGRRLSFFFSNAVLGLGLGLELTLTLTLTLTSTLH